MSSASSEFAYRFAICATCYKLVVLIESFRCFNCRQICCDDHSVDGYAICPRCEEQWKD